MLTWIAPMMAVAYWTWTHSAKFGLHIATRSPRPTPRDIRPSCHRRRPWRRTRPRSDECPGERQPAPPGRESAAIAFARGSRRSSRRAARCQCAPVDCCGHDHSPCDRSDPHRTAARRRSRRRPRLPSTLWQPIPNSASTRSPELPNRRASCSTKSARPRRWGSVRRSSPSGSTSRKRRRSAVRQPR